MNKGAVIGGLVGMLVAIGFVWGADLLLMRYSLYDGIGDVWQLFCAAIGFAFASIGMVVGADLWDKYRD